LISLFRIDDRLIHGQVIVGWGVKLNPDKYVIIDDEIEDWEAEIYLGSLEDDSKGEVVTTQEAADLINDWESCKEHIIILVKDPFTLKRLLDNGVDVPEINLGGIHYLEGRKRFLNCLYLYDEEYVTLKNVISNCKVSYQPLPCDHKVDLSSVL
jgi:mannose/fructose/N-acetylgalactosamine-specific phosphotransferase system component IIB